MKTYKNLYPHVYSFSNLYQAFRAARRGKRDRAAVAGFEFDLERNLLELEAELRDQTYRPGPYTNFYIYEPKRRLVSAAPFRDRVVHHALCQVIEPIWEARFIDTSYACRLGKGTHRASGSRSVIRRWLLRGDRSTRCCAGVAGTIIQRTSARPTATTTHRTIATITSAFGVWFRQAWISRRPGILGLWTRG